MTKPIYEAPRQEKMRTAIDKQTQEILGLSRFFSNLEHPKSEPQSMIKASVLEAVFLDTAEVLIRDLRAEDSVGRKMEDCLRVYIGASNGFSDMYVTRDVTNRVKHSLSN